MQLKIRNEDTLQWIKVSQLFSWNCPKDDTSKTMNGDDQLSKKKSLWVISLGLVQYANLSPCVYSQNLLSVPLPHGYCKYWPNFLFRHLGQRKKSRIFSFTTPLSKFFVKYNWPCSDAIVFNILRKEKKLHCKTLILY